MIAPGESKQSSKSSRDDISASRRGGRRPHQGASGRTKQQLYNEAKDKGIKGRSKMAKAELEKRSVVRPRSFATGSGSVLPD